jgi:hypothetical protein
LPAASRKKSLGVNGGNEDRELTKGRLEVAAEKLGESVGTGVNATSATTSK